MCFGVRARADQRHFPFDDIDELRQFVEAEALSQPPSRVVRASSGRAC